MAQIDNHVEDIMGLSQWETHDNPTISKIACDDIKDVFLAVEWNSFHLLGEKKLDLLHLKDFLKYECELYFNQPLTPLERKNHCYLLHLEP